MQVFLSSDLLEDVLLSHELLSLSVRFGHDHIQDGLTAVDDVGHEENHVLQQLDGVPDRQTAQSINSSSFPTTRVISSSRATLLAVVLADEALAELVHHGAQHRAGIVGKVQVSDFHHGNGNDGERLLVLFGGTRPQLHEHHMNTHFSSFLFQTKINEEQTFIHPGN